MIVHVRHVLQAGLCVRGLRAWCRANAVDLREICNEGIDTDRHPQLHADPFVVRVMAVAREEGQADV